MLNTVLESVAEPSLRTFPSSTDAAGCQSLMCAILGFTFWSYFGFKSSGFFKGRMCASFRVKSRSAAAYAAAALRSLNRREVFFVLGLDFCVISAEE